MRHWSQPERFGSEEQRHNIKRSAAKRLLRDLKEIQECDELLETVNALPLEDNIFEWHLNMRPKDGPLAGGIFHAIMKFAENYPMVPPKVELKTPLPGHPNVFGENICLDMLKPHTTKKLYEGWSHAYSVVSIIMQLQSFLFAENVPQEYGGSTRNHSGRYGGVVHGRRRNTYSCSSCPHCPSGPWPPLETPAREPQPRSPTQRLLRAGNVLCRQRQPRARDPALNSTLRRRPERQMVDVKRLSVEVFGNDDLLNLIMDFLPTKDVIRCKHASPVMCEGIERYNIWGRREIKCFFSKESFATAALGVGITVENFEGRDSLTGRNNAGLPKNITSSMDYLSRAAFYDREIRQGVWGESFDNWLPLIISSGHGKRVHDILRQKICELCDPRRYSQFWTPSRERTAVSDSDDEGLDPTLICSLDSTKDKAFADSALNVLSCLMNSMAVSMVKPPETKKKPLGRSGPFGGEEPAERHHVSMCEKALLGYCSFHHTLLFLAERYPHMREIANERVRMFKQDRAARHKRSTRDLGKFLVCLCLSDLGWEDIQEEFLQEVRARNVMWATRGAKYGSMIKRIPSVRSADDHIRTGEELRYFTNKRYKVVKKATVRESRDHRSRKVAVCEIGETVVFSKLRVVGDHLRGLVSFEHEAEWISVASMDGKRVWVEAEPQNSTDIEAPAGARVMAAWNPSDRDGKIRAGDLDFVGFDRDFEWYPATVRRAKHRSRVWEGVKVAFDDDDQSDDAEWEDPESARHDQTYFRRMDCIRPLEEERVTRRRTGEDLCNMFFQETIVGKRLIMFQVYFLRHIGRPAQKSPAEVLKFYDKRLGRPPLAMQCKLQDAAKDIMNVTSWPEYYAMVGRGEDTDASPRRMLSRLQDAFTDSANAGYTRMGGVRRDSRRSSDRRAAGQPAPPAVPTSIWWGQSFAASALTATTTPPEATSASSPEAKIDYSPRSSAPAPGGGPLRTLDANRGRKRRGTKRGRDHSGQSEKAPAPKKARPTTTRDNDSEIERRLARRRARFGTN